MAEVRSITKGFWIFKWTTYEVVMPNLVPLPFRTIESAQSYADLYNKMCEDTYG